jgi:hypothetical protein
LPKDIVCKFFLLDSPIPMYVVLCLIETKGKHLVSLSAGFSMEECISKSFFESMNSIQLFDINLQNLKDGNIKASTIMNHTYYYLEPENASNLNWIKQSKTFSPLYTK